MPIPAPPCGTTGLASRWTAMPYIVATFIAGASRGDPDAAEALALAESVLFHRPVDNNPVSEGQHRVAALLKHLHGDGRRCQYGRGW
jgi:hypothetical protein